MTLIRLVLVMCLMVSFNANAKFNLKLKKFTGGHSIGLDASSMDAYIYTDKRYRSSVIKEIQAQLKFMVGQFNHFHGVVNLPKTVIEITDMNSNKSGVRKVKYSATFFVSWGEVENIPERIKIIVPEMGTASFIANKFYPKYGGGDSKIAGGCLDDYGRSTTSNIWYHYRPLKKSCPLRDRIPGMNDRAISFHAKMVKSSTNTKNKFPEYDEVWKDNEINVVLAFAKDKHGATSSSDAGFNSLKEMTTSLMRNYGHRLNSATYIGDQVTPDSYRNDLSFDITAFVNGETRNGTLNVTLFYIDRMWSEGQSFYDEFNDAARNADVVGYSGHAGLGANVNAFENMVRAESGQYRIYILNNCDTFGYLTSKIQDKHKEANPNYNEGKFADIISTSMPAYFHELADSNMVLIDALVDGVDTYKTLLRRMDPYQRSIVIGEEDNRFPKSFYE